MVPEVIALKALEPASGDEIMIAPVPFVIVIPVPAVSVLNA